MSIYYSLSEIGADTAENEPSKFDHSVKTFGVKYSIVSFNLALHASRARLLEERLRGRDRRRELLGLHGREVRRQAGALERDRDRARRVHDAHAAAHRAAELVARPAQVDRRNLEALLRVAQRAERSDLGRGRAAADRRAHAEAALEQRPDDEEPEEAGPA